MAYHVTIIMYNDVIVKVAYEAFDETIREIKALAPAFNTVKSILIEPVEQIDPEFVGD